MINILILSLKEHSILFYPHSGIIYSLKTSLFDLMEQSLKVMNLEINFNSFTGHQHAYMRSLSHLKNNQKALI